MKFIWCTECFPNHHHDENFHHGGVVTAEQANRDVKATNAYRTDRTPLRKGARTGRKRGTKRR